ncbi:hypothetical protein [Clostridium sp. JN-9]|uniref:hypothetical protein n=1 Tax=Clostridium sp. JN-9 TaxID=2507159 RepID=UPI000FFE1FB5|nr:hypothetical protein [Clostridium sp. JN-9]QAT40704.1 hypothetical protein EQM05_10755 [Clostridium sp. JN-9]
MEIVIVFIVIFAFAIFFSRNNLKKRTEEIHSNLENFNIEIKDFFYKMSDDAQKEFLDKLNEDWKGNFESILNDSFNYGSNVWSLQSQISAQQELFKALHDFNEKHK